MLLFCDIVIVKLFCNNVSMRKEQYNMTEREMQKLVVINKVIDGTLTNNEAAQMLDLSVRQVFRLKKGVKEQGPSFVIHKNKGYNPTRGLFAARRLFLPCFQFVSCFIAPRCGIYHLKFNSRTAFFPRHLPITKQIRDTL